MRPERLVAALEKAIDRLLEMRSPRGNWEGRLSSSALSTATAVSAFAIAGQPADTECIRSGVTWLVRHQNQDGGWGDTPDSPSNLSTSLLVAAALKLAHAHLTDAGTETRLKAYLDRVAGATQAQRREAVCAAYAPDRTFAVPILTNLALAGDASWDAIPRLPFELAACPTGLLRFLRLHVVSYALPALIAVGLVLEHHQRPCFLMRRWLRAAAKSRALQKLRAFQPASGGFLEAIPLTSFVTMSLVPLQGVEEPVVREGLRFLREAKREDGSWPIDTNLAVWLTTASMTALCDVGRRGEVGKDCEAWLISAQHNRRHPYTGAAPGGWAWTDRPGGVPDADDTAGAVIALKRLLAPDEVLNAGVRWLLRLQNADGGWPTFCRGWGRLPFDRSAPDLTAHVLRALKAFDPEGGIPAISSALRRGLGHLNATVKGDGSWRPLWFGHQAAHDQANPVLGTARVLRALEVLDGDHGMARRGVQFLLGAQNEDGGWGGEAGAASTTEETALAVSALVPGLSEPSVNAAVENGVRNLVERVESGQWLEPAPIGLYFARLWYSEAAYPVIWTVEALGRVRVRTSGGMAN